MDLEPQRTEISHLAGCLLGVAVGVIWTTVGFLVAALQGTRQQFLNEWFLLQGFPMMSVGTWLLYTIVSGRFEHHVATLTDGPLSRPLRNTNLGFVITGLIGVVGTSSLIALGFNAHGIVLAFFWLTCALICLTAGYVTAHAVEILLVVHWGFRGKANGIPG